MGENAFLSLASTAVWVIFIAEFALRLMLAPDRWDFLQSNWLTVIALIVSALRFFRALAVLRAARALRG